MLKVVVRSSEWVWLTTSVFMMYTKIMLSCCGMLVKTVSKFTMAMLLSLTWSQRVAAILTHE